MTEPRSTAQEAGDPSTSPERLLELTEKHPQLHRLIVQNPSCPEVARQWILATNPWAKRAYEESPGVVPEPAEGAAPEPSEGAVPEDGDREAVSVWGDLGLGATSAAAPQAQPEEAPTPSVRIAQNSSVVPLGSPATVSTPPTPAPPTSPDPESPAAPAAPAASAPGAVAAAAAPVLSAQPDYAAYPDHGVAPAPGERPVADDTTSGDGAAPGFHPAAVAGGAAGGAAAASPYDSSADDGSRTRRRTLFACGGCLVLALLLILGLALLGRAWLGGDDEEYQRDSSTTAAEESPAETPSEEPTEQETTADPVSPAPEGAREMSALRSPTGNISCLLEEDSVSCSVLEHDYSGSGAEGCESGPFSITVAGGNPSRACGSSFLDDSSDTLEYDDSAVHGNMACTSRFDGMTCWNTLTGKGFMVNRSTYETF